MENTSGLGPQSHIPEEIKGWNWGAFFFNWIWGLFNGTFIALLTLVPCVGWVMVFVLGIKGNEWAWRNKKWESVERFKQVQRYWAYASLALLAGSLIFAAAIVFGVFGIMKQSDVYKDSLARVQNNPQIIQVLGSPIESGWWISGNINTSIDSGHATLSYPVHGPKNSARVYLKAEKVLSRWEFQRLLVQPKGQEPVNLLTEP